MDLRQDPERIDARDHTGIYVRAKDIAGRVKNVDLIELTRESVITWLREGGAQRAELTVLILLGHKPDLTREAPPT